MPYLSKGHLVHNPFKWTFGFLFRAPKSHQTVSFFWALTKPCCTMEHSTFGYPRSWRRKRLVGSFNPWPCAHVQIVYTSHLWPEPKLTEVSRKSDWLHGLWIWPLKLADCWEWNTYQPSSLWPERCVLLSHAADIPIIQIWMYYYFIPAGV